MKTRTYYGFLYRGLKDEQPNPHDKFHLTLKQAQSMIPKLRGSPIVIGHGSIDDDVRASLTHSDVANIAVGHIDDAWINNQGHLGIKFKIGTRGDDNSIAMTHRLMDRKMMNELSMRHLFYSDDDGGVHVPVEASLVPRGARDGCYIYSEEDYKALHGGPYEYLAKDGVTIMAAEPFNNGGGGGGAPPIQQMTSPNNTNTTEQQQQQQALAQPQPPRSLNDILKAGLSGDNGVSLDKDGARKIIDALAESQKQAELNSELIKSMKDVNERDRNQMFNVIDNLSNAVKISGLPQLKQVKQLQAELTSGKHDSVCASAPFQAFMNSVATTVSASAPSQPPPQPHPSNGRVPMQHHASRNMLPEDMKRLEMLGKIDNMRSIMNGQPTTAAAAPLSQPAGGTQSRRPTGSTRKKRGRTNQRRRRYYSDDDDDDDGVDHDHDDNDLYDNAPARQQRNRLDDLNEHKDYRWPKEQRNRTNNYTPNPYNEAKFDTNVSYQQQPQSQPFTQKQPTASVAASYDYNGSGMSLGGEAPPRDGGGGGGGVNHALAMMDRARTMNFDSCDYRYTTQNG